MATKTTAKTKTKTTSRPKTRNPPRGWLTSPDMAKVALTVEETAYKLSISRSSCYRLMQRHELRFILIGGTRRIPVDAVNEYVSRQLAS